MSAADGEPSQQQVSEQKSDTDQVADSLQSVESAAEKLTREVATVIDALKKKASDSARATRDHSEIVLQASLGVKDGVKMVEQASMEALLQASEMRKHIADLTTLAKMAEKVRRDLFYLEIEASRLRDKAVKRMSRAASAKSARAVQKSDAEGVELQPVVKRVQEKEDEKDDNTKMLQREGE